MLRGATAGGLRSCLANPLCESRPVLLALDSAKALHAAANWVWGQNGVIQRRQVIRFSRRSGRSVFWLGFRPELGFQLRHQLLRAPRPGAGPKRTAAQEVIAAQPASRPRAAATACWANGSASALVTPDFGSLPSPARSAAPGPVRTSDQVSGRGSHIPTARRRSASASMMPSHGPGPRRGGHN